MKLRISAILALAGLLCCLSACQKDRSYEDNTDPAISYYQITGTWQLTEWKGEKIDGQERYVYMTLESKEQTFGIYQNLDSAQPRHLTGSFELEYDEDEGVNVISGLYDHASGFWNNEYVITSITEDMMEWTVKGDPTDVSVYRRCSSLPDFDK